MRTVDRVARFGGEEFALVLMQTDLANASDVARRMCTAIARDPIMAADSVALNVTVSAGVALLPADAPTGAALISAADKALYAAKGRGRDRVAVFDEL